MKETDGFRDLPHLRETYYAGRPFGSIKPWEYPDCPECGVEIYVRIEAGTGRRFECVRCEETFRARESNVQECVDEERNERARRARRAQKG